MYKNTILVDRVDPLFIMMYIGVDSRNMGATSNTPCHQPHHSPPSRLCLADEGASSVSSARVLTVLCSGAHLSLCELEPIPNTRFLLVESLLQSCVALRGRHNWHVNLVLNELERSREFIFAPSSRPASCSSTVAEDIIELLLARWEASGGHIRVLEVDNPGCDHHSNVVAEALGVKLRVPDDFGHGVFNVAPSLRGVEATCVIFTNAHLHAIIGSDFLEIMSCSQDLASTTTQVVVEGLGNKSTSAEEVVVLVKDQTGPRELSRT